MKKKCVTSFKDDSCKEIPIPLVPKTNDWKLLIRRSAKKQRSKIKEFDICFSRFFRFLKVESKISSQIPWLLKFKEKIFDVRFEGLI